VVSTLLERSKFYKDSKITSIKANNLKEVEAVAAAPAITR